jgi:hypothetical protein
MADTVTGTTSAHVVTPHGWTISIDGDPEHAVFAYAEEDAAISLDAMTGFGVGSRVTIEKRDPRPPLILGIAQGV